MRTLVEEANKATVAEASELLGVPFQTIQAAIRRGDLSHTMEPRRVRCKWGLRTIPVRIVNLEDVEARYCVTLPEPTDPHELARQRGIKLKSARRNLQRKGLL